LECKVEIASVRQEEGQEEVVAAAEAECKAHQEEEAQESIIIAANSANF